MSNTLALGFMPLNIWVYSRSWTDEKLYVPYKNIIISLIMTVTPAAIGVFVRWKWEKIALTITKVSFINIWFEGNVKFTSAKSVFKRCYRFFNTNLSNITKSKVDIFAINYNNEVGKI